jgi:glycosyltransferase involved in cell wall biosynthesis
MHKGTKDNRIRIVLFDEAVAFGGSVVVLAHLLNNLDRRTFRPLVVTSLDASSVQQLFRSEDILYWFRPRLDYSDRIRWMARGPARSELAKRLWAYLFSAAQFLANLPGHLAMYYKVWRARPDIIHVNNGREGLLAARAFKVPLLFHFHGMSPGLIFGTYDTRFVAAAFVSISRFISEEAVKLGVPRDRIVDIPNPAPRVATSQARRLEWRQKYGIPDDAVLLAHVGRLIRWKGQLEFLKAFRRIADDCPQAFVLIVGDDVEGFSAQYPQSLRALVEEAGLGQRVVFTGHVQDVLGLMSAADIVVHSSIEPEPFGLVITEAMAAGAAVVASRLGAPTEIVTHGVTGILVDPADEKEFAAALAELVQNPARRRQLAEAGHRLALDRYSPESFARQIEDVYRTINARSERTR